MFSPQSLIFYGGCSKLQQWLQRRNRLIPRGVLRAAPAWHSFCSTHSKSFSQAAMHSSPKTHRMSWSPLPFQKLNHVCRAKAGSWQEGQPFLRGQSATTAKAHTLKSTYFPINGQSLRHTLWTDKGMGRSPYVHLMKEQFYGMFGL